MNKLVHKRMRYLGIFENIAFYEYSPSFFCPYFMDYPKENHPNYESRLIHKIRMMLEYIRGGYRVFYMVYDDNIVGHIVVANGGRRLKISTKSDIVVGPVFISPNMRGKGIGTTGILIVLNQLGLQYNYAYEFIHDDNIASIRTVEKNGYTFVGRVKESGLLKNLIKSSDGNYVVYRYSKKL